MAGRQLEDDTLIGVGSAFRKARIKRRLTLDQASRDTKLTVDQLRALEEEDFDALLGDPYVRGALRTYARYLGLNDEKVAAAYARHAEDPEPPPPPAKLGPIERAIAATRIRDSQRMLVLAALTLITIAVVFGFVSRGRSTPPQAELASPATGVQPVDRQIQAELVAVIGAEVAITIDGGQPLRMVLTEGETRSFVATSSMTIRIVEGGTVQVTVAGRDLGTPGKPGKPWQETFSFETPEASTSPSV